MVIGLADSLQFLFYDYSTAIGGMLIALSLISVVIRLLWEFR